MANPLKMAFSCHFLDAFSPRRQGCRTDQRCIIVCRPRPNRTGVPRSVHDCSADFAKRETPD
jgi:hypothetical protein